MLIALDARTLVAPERRGIAKSLHHLYHHLAKARPDWEVVAYHRQKQVDPAVLPAMIKRQTRIEIRGDRYDAWMRLRLPMACRQDAVDVLHCPANACPKWMPVPTVVTLHDLIPLDLPQGRTEEELDRFETSVRWACRRAAVVVCPSHVTLQRLIAEHDLDPARGMVVPWAPTLDPTALKADTAREVLDRHGVSTDFMLHFGAPEPRKNTLRVIEAWAMTTPRYRKHRRLLIVGLDPAMRERCEQAAVALGVASSVQVHGFVEEADLPVLLRYAQALLYPSLSEGFGLPILEAFATETPVLASSRGALGEVGGNAVELVNPESPVAMAKGISKLLKDPLRRRDLIIAGKRQLKSFQWDQAAERFACALELAQQSARRPARSGRVTPASSSARGGKRRWTDLLRRSAA